jgi:hypothetical protein
MQIIVLAAAAIATALPARVPAAEAGSAGALTVSCAPPQTLAGRNPQAPNDETIGATVSHIGGQWSIQYVFTNGSKIWREKQYTIADSPTLLIRTVGLAYSTKTETCG